MVEWLGWVFTESAGLSSCVLVAISPRPPRQAGVCAPRNALGRHPPGDPRRWRPARGPVAGAQLGIEPLDAKRPWHQQVTG
jgi:hypothetical protein